MALSIVVPQAKVDLRAFQKQAPTFLMQIPDDRALSVADVGKVRSATSLAQLQTVLTDILQREQRRLAREEQIMNILEHLIIR